MATGRKLTHTPPPLLTAGFYVSCLQKTLGRKRVHKGSFKDGKWFPGKLRAERGQEGPIRGLRGPEKMRSGWAGH